MATFKIMLDTRNQKKDGTYNLSVRIINKDDVMFFSITSLTKFQYAQLFGKNTATDEASIAFREKCNKYKAKCERVFNEIQPFNKKIFREKLKEKEKAIPQSLLLRNLVSDYIKNRNDIKLKTKDLYRTMLNVFEAYKKDITIQDITIDFLKSFSDMKSKDGCSIPTINTYHRHLRAILNHYTNVDKIIPASYVYPYGRSGYPITSFRPVKQVFSPSEIREIINYNKFDSFKQEYALAIWKMLYYSNGSNFIDLLKLQWKDVKMNYASYIRTKTENTRRNNIQPVIVPMRNELKELFDQYGDKQSSYILGKMNGNYGEQKLNNKNKKLRAQINEELKAIGNELNLSIPFTLSTARDCYATTLHRTGVSTSLISKMLNHSNSIVTEHYLSSLNPDETFEINAKLIFKN